MSEFRDRWVFSDSILATVRYYGVFVIGNVLSFLDEATGTKLSAYFTGLTINDDVVTTNNPLANMDVLAFKSTYEYTGSTAKTTQTNRTTTLNNGTVNTGFGLNGFYSLVETPATNVNNHTAGINACNFVHAYYGGGTCNATHNGLAGAYNYGSTATNNTPGTQYVTGNGLTATASVSNSGSIGALRGAIITTNLSSTGGCATEVVGMYDVVNLTSTGTCPDIKGATMVVAITGSPAGINYLYGSRTALDIRPATNITVANMYGQDVNVSIGVSSVGTPSVTTTMVGVNCNVVVQKSSTVGTLSGAWFYAGSNTAGAVANINYLYAINCKSEAKDCNVTNHYGIAVTGSKDSAGVIGTWYGVYINSSPITSTMGAGITVMWDIYQNNPSANNYFAGSIRIGSTTNYGTRNDALQVVGTTSFGNASSGADYSQFEADGTLVMKGNATVWGDIDFPMIVRTTGTSIPVHTTVLGNLTMPLWQVNDFVQADIQEIPHDWKEASALQWHCHIITNTLDATARYVQFEVEYTWANRGGALITPVVLSSGDLLIPANTPAKTHLIFNIGAAWTPVGGTIAAHVKARMKRIASVGTAPTNHPFCEMLQLHYEKDTIGSRQIVTK